MSDYAVFEDAFLKFCSSCDSCSVTENKGNVYIEASLDNNERIFGPYKMPSWFPTGSLEYDIGIIEGLSEGVNKL